MAGFVILLITFSVAEEHNPSKALSVGKCNLTFNPLEKLPLHGEKGSDARVRLLLWGQKKPSRLLASSTAGFIAEVSWFVTTVFLKAR